jgi:hypothetical protein
MSAVKGVPWAWVEIKDVENGATVRVKGFYERAKMLTNMQLLSTKTFIAFQCRILSYAFSCFCFYVRQEKIKDHQFPMYK